MGFGIRAGAGTGGFQVCVAILTLIEKHRRHWAFCTVRAPLYQNATTRGPNVSMSNFGFLKLSSYPHQFFMVSGIQNCTKLGYESSAFSFIRPNLTWKKTRIQPLSTSIRKLVALHQTRRGGKSNIFESAKKNVDILGICWA